MQAIRVVAVSVILLMFTGCEQAKDVNYVAPQNFQDQRTQQLAVDQTAIRQQAIDIVKAALSDSSPNIRSNAIEIVSSTKTPELIADVQALLSDDIIPVRFAAAMAMGDIKQQEAIPELTKMLADPSANVQLASAYAMQKMGQGRYEQLYQKGIKSLNQTVRANTALILGKLGDRGAIAPLHSLINDAESSDRVRFQAIEATAMLQDGKAYQKIWTMLISTYADDRVMGIRAMGSLGTVQAANAIITLLDDPILEVRLAAAEQLGAMGNKLGEPEVLDYFLGKGIDPEDRNSDRAKTLAALAVGRIDTPALKKYLPDLLQSPSKPVQLAAAKSVLLLNQ